METTKPRTVNSIGMFDMLKGAGMLAIVLGHTAELYPLQLEGGLSLTAFVGFIYRETLMAAFFIASGYGFRKRSISKCIHQQLKSLLKPFCYTAVFTTVLHFIIHYKTFHYLPGSMTESIKVAGGFLLGLPHTATYFGQEFFSCGPMWYLLALLMGFIVGLIIALVYRKAFRGVLFSPSFANTLIMLCMITTPVVMCIKSNIALSMGMVGALSIVRFRTAVKDPLDTAYMFWSLTMGILLGAELYTIALVVVAGISIAMLALAFFRLRTPNTFLLVTHYDQAAEAEVMDFIRRIKVQRLRSKTVTPGGVELTVEVQLRERFDIVNKLMDTEGVHNATLIACQSEAGN